MSSPFGTRQSSGVWCRIAGGKVVRNADERTPGAVKVEKMKNGQGTGEYRWELHDDTVEGKLLGFERKTQTFGNETLTTLVVKLVHQHSGTQVNVQLTEGGRYWRAFMYRLPNVDTTRDIVIAPYDFVPQGEAKSKIGLNVLQGNDKVLPRFTKDQPGDMPDAKTVTFQGKDRLDFFDQDEWLNKVVLLPINAKIAEIANAHATNEAAVADMPPVNNDDDDLPF